MKNNKILILLLIRGENDLQDSVSNFDRKLEVLISLWLIPSKANYCSSCCLLAILLFYEMCFFV